MLLLAIAFAWWGARVRREARIDDAVRLIAQSPGWWPGEDYNPIAVVRAVNALHALGKQDAISALRRFAHEYPSNGDPDDRHEALRLVLPLLFDRENPEDRFPESAPDRDSWRTHLGTTEWLFFSTSVRVMDDIPFNRNGMMFFSGEMDDFSYAIDWAEKSGRFRTTPLMPADDPFAAAEREMIDLARINGGSEIDSRLARSIREQVFNAVVHLLPPQDKGNYRYGDNWDGSELSESFRDLADDEIWAALKKLCAPLKIRWSSERQAYIGTKRP